MELREKIIREMVNSGIESEELISLVIGDAFYNINKATAFNSSVEVTGLGKFQFNKKKADKLLPNYKQALTKTNNPEKEKALIETINYIESKQ